MTLESNIVTGGVPFRNHASRLYTPAEVDDLLFGDGSAGNTIPTLSGRFRANLPLNAVTLSVNLGPSGLPLRCRSLTIDPGGQLNAIGSATGNGIGALDFATGTPGTGQGGLWSGANGARMNAATAVFTDAGDILANGGGDGGAVLSGPGANRGGSVNGGAALNGVDDLTTLLNVRVGGGAGGGCYAAGVYEDIWGGGGGGVIVVRARTMTLSVGGGIGGVAFAAYGGPGQGGVGLRPAGGGGGGVIILIARTFLPSRAALIAACNTVGGTGANGGTDGGPGRVGVFTVAQLGLP